MPRLTMQWNSRCLTLRAQMHADSADINRGCAERTNRSQTDIGPLWDARQLRHETASARLADAAARAQPDTEAER